MARSCTDRNTSRSIRSRSTNFAGKILSGKGGEKMASQSGNLFRRISTLTGIWRGMCQAFSYPSPPSKSFPPLAMGGLLHPSYHCQPAYSFELGKAADLVFPWHSGVVLFAAPQKRTSHSRKRKRMTSKWLKNIVNYTICPECGNARRLHVLCGYCLRKTLVETAQIRRQRDQRE